MAKFVGYVAQASPKMFVKLTATLTLSCIFAVTGNYLLSMLVGHMEASYEYGANIIMLLVAMVVIARVGAQYIQKGYQYYAALSSEEVSFRLQKRIIEKP